MAPVDVEPEEDDTPSCDCCGFDDPVGGVTEYDKGGPNMGRWSICQLCAGSFIGTLVAYTQVRHNVDPLLARSLSWIGNRIRRDIAEKK